MLRLVSTNCIGTTCDDMCQVDEPFLHAWVRPEEITVGQPAYLLNETGSAVAADTAAALAAGSMLFRDKGNRRLTNMRHHPLLTLRSTATASPTSLCITDHLTLLRCCYLNLSNISTGFLQRVPDGINGDIRLLYRCVSHCAS